MVYRTKIEHRADFEERSIGGRKVACVVTLDERYYLSMLNNKILRFHRAILKLTDEIGELEERERNLYYFIREREGLL